MYQYFRNINTDDNTGKTVEEIHCNTSDTQCINHENIWPASVIWTTGQKYCWLVFDLSHVFAAVQNLFQVAIIFSQYTSCWRVFKLNSPQGSDQVTYVVSLAAQWNDEHLSTGVHWSQYIFSACSWYYWITRAFTEVVQTQMLQDSQSKLFQSTGCANKKQSPRKNAVFQTW